MLPGLISFLPLPPKFTCPRTRNAGLAPDRNDSTRLLPESAASRSPCASSATALTPDRDAPEACGKEPVLAVTVAKSGWPRTCVAGVPEVVAGANTRIRLSLGTATYRVPPEFTATPVGPAMEDEVGICGTPRVVGLGSPYIIVAADADVRGAGNFMTRVLKKSAT